MSLIPRNTNTSDNQTTPFTPFSQNFWDRFFSHDFPLQPFTNFPFSPFLSPPRTVPYSELAVETSGDVRTRLECKEIPEAHLIVADLPAGIDKQAVDVAAEDGGFVKISAVDGRFSWRLRLPEDAKVDLLSFSVENGVFTVVVPKFAREMMWERGDNERGGRDVRVVEITGEDE